MSSYDDFLSFLSPEQEEALAQEAAEELKAMIQPVEQVPEAPSNSASEALTSLLQASQAAPEDVFVGRDDVVVRGDLPSEPSTGSFSKASPGTADRAYLNITPGGNARYKAFREKGFSDSEALALAVNAVSEEERRNLAAEELAQEKLAEMVRSNKAGEANNARATDIEEFYKRGLLDHGERELGVKYDTEMARLKNELALQEMRGEQDRDLLSTKQLIQEQLANQLPPTDVELAEKRLAQGKVTTPELSYQSNLPLIPTPTDLLKKLGRVFGIGDIGYVGLNMDARKLLAAELGLEEKDPLVKRLVEAMESQAKDTGKIDMKKLIEGLRS